MVYWVDNKTAPKVKQRKEPVFSDAVLWFADEIGKTPTIPQAAWFNMIQAELLGLAEYLGITPDKLDDNQLAVGLKAAFDKVGVDIQGLPKVLDALGESRKDAASQRIVNAVNQLAKDAQTAANIANDKANQAKQEAYNAGQSAEGAHKKIDSLTTNPMLVSTALDKLKQQNKLDIVCVGDSITYGFDITSPDRIPASPGHARERAPVQYPLQLEKELQRIYSTKNINVVNYGYSGDTVKTSFEREMWKVNPSCDLAIISFGINDRFKQLPVQEFFEYFIKWIERLNSWGTGVIIATSTLIKSGGDNSQTSGYRIAAKNIGGLMGCPVISTDEFVENYKNETIYSDNTHFNKDGYRILGNSIAWFIASGCQYKKIASSILINSNEENAVTDGDRYLAEGSYNTTSYQLLLATDGKKKVTFPIYLDCEAAELNIGGYVGTGSQIIIDSDNLRSTTFVADGASTTTNYSARKDVRTFPQLRDVYVGRLIGKGWHSITITSPTNKIDPNYLGTYIGYLKVKPVEQVEVFSDAAYRIDKRSFVIIDPPIDGVFEASGKTKFIVPSSVVSKTRVNNGLWHAVMPLKITILSASATVTPQVSESYIQMYKASEYVVSSVVKSADNAPVVTAMKSINSNDVEITINRPYEGFIKILIEAHDAPISQSLLY